MRGERRSNGKQQKEFKAKQQAAKSLIILQAIHTFLNRIIDSYTSVL